MDTLLGKDEADGEEGAPDTQLRDSLAQLGMAGWTSKPYCLADAKSRRSRETGAGGLFSGDAPANEFGKPDAMLDGDHLRGLLADHDCRCVGIACDHRRHDAGVRHPQPADPEHT